MSNRIDEKRTDKGDDTDNDVKITSSTSLLIMKLNQLNQMRYDVNANYLWIDKWDLNFLYVLSFKKVQTINSCLSKWLHRT